MGSEQMKVLGLIGLIAAIVFGVLAIDVITRQIAFLVLLVGIVSCICAGLFFSARQDTESLKGWLYGAIILTVAAGIAQISIRMQEDSANNDMVPATVVESLTADELDQVVDLALQDGKLSMDGLAERVSMAQLPVLFTEIDPEDTFGGDRWLLERAEDSWPGQIKWGYLGSTFELVLPSNYFCAYWYTVANSEEQHGIGPNRIPDVTSATLFFKPTPYSPSECP